MLLSRGVGQVLAQLPLGVVKGMERTFQHKYQRGVAGDRDPLESRAGPCLHLRPQFSPHLEDEAHTVCPSKTRRKWF